MGDSLATIDMGRKVGAVLPFFGGGLGPHLTQCGWGRGLYLDAKFHLDPSNRLAVFLFNATSCSDTGE